MTRKIHFEKRGAPGRMVFTTCGWPTHQVEVTTNTDLVTCKMCLNSIPYLMASRGWTCGQVSLRQRLRDARAAVSRLERAIRADGGGDL